MDTNFAYFHTAFWGVALLVAIYWENISQKIADRNFLNVFKHPVVLYPVVFFIGMPMALLAIVLFFYWLIFVPSFILSGFDIESANAMIKNINNLWHEHLTGK